MRSLLLVGAVMAAAVLTGCRDKDQAPAPPATQAGAAPVGVMLALNWKAEPEFGGFYEARRAGLFQQRGLDVTIKESGDQVLSQLKGGQAQFGILAADEVVGARANGLDLVAVFAIYQTNPQGIMAHRSRGFTGIGDVLRNEGTLAVQPLKYVDFLKNKYGPVKVKIMPYDFSTTKFETDKTHSQQCFVTAEPIAVARKGNDPQVFLIAESGFNPYAGLVVVRGDYLKANRQVVDAFVAACRQGWRAYLDDPKPANAVMGALNKDMDAETFAAGAEKQKPLIEDEFTKSNGLGAMSADRWQTLGRQLVDLGAVKQAPPAADCFVNSGK